MIRAQSDELAFPPAPRVMEVLRNHSADLLRRYQKKPPLLETLAKKFSVPASQIFLEQGTMGIMHRVLDYRLQAGSKVLLPELSFPPYVKIATQRGAIIDFFRVQEKDGKFSYDLSDLLSKVPGQSLVVLVDPESPLGYSLPNADFKRVMSHIGPDTLVLLDQAHEGFRVDHVKDIGALAREYPNLIVARSFSKYYGLAGLRIGFAVCGEQAKEMAHFQERYLGFDNLSQALAEAALASESYYSGIAGQIRKEKERCNEVMESYGYAIFRTDQMSVVVRVTPSQREAINAHCDSHGISIRDLTERDPRLANMYRITMGPPHENEEILKAFATNS